MERVGVWNPPSMPVHSGVTYNDIWGYTAPDGSEYAILGNVDSILVIDVTIPSSPQRIFGHYGGGHAIWRDFKVFQDHVYAVCDGCSEGLHIFDMSALPGGEVTHVSTTNAFFNRAHNIFIDTTTQKLYACGTNNVNKGLVILDLSTPSNPTLIDNYLFEGSGNFYVHDLYVQNDTAYCSHGNQGYYVWDMRDLNNVDLLGSYDSPGYNHSSWNHSSGQYAYYAEEVPLGRPMAVIDLTNLGHPTLDITVDLLFKDPISNTALNVTPHNPFVKNDSLFISYYEDGFKVYDLAVPDQPQLVGYYDTYPDNGSSYTGYEGAWGTYPFFDSRYLMISDISYGLNIVKMQTCANPTMYYRDRDGDGYGDPNKGVASCSDPGSKYVTNDQDCDDDDDLSYPMGDEICDGKDNDCDGLVDDADPDIIYDTFYRDEDNDGFGNANITTQACSAPVGYVDNNLDCDDTNNMVNPNFPEICDGIDNDCDGDVDQNDNDITSIEWSLDNDGDGYGDGVNILFQCEQPLNYSAFPTDCDDNDANNYPFNTEICDGQDNNCDDIIDENCGLEPCDGFDVYVNPIVDSIYRAKNILSSDAVSAQGDTVAFYAAQKIELNEGFEVQVPGVFLAAIEDCDNSGGGNALDADPISMIHQVHREDDLVYFVKTQNHSVTQTFEELEELQKYLEALKLEDQAFKLYIFDQGELLNK